MSTPTASERNALVRLTYRGYVADVHWDTEARMFYARVRNSRDVITAESGTLLEGMYFNLRDSIDDYLAFCAASRVEPNRTPDPAPDAVSLDTDSGFIMLGMLAMLFFGPTGVPCTTKARGLLPAIRVRSTPSSRRAKRRARKAKRRAQR